ncbi:hypothetical protein O3G_MSEX006425 [Manduca sexta]|uniref:WAP domain-containing protein n=1 Tax=Manduca sexta TaxID=7130 RepID=A0A921Z240_MANSE|nr:hypothetical protein O3G_MSEX006425 [Manduca sexta]KAG6450106.1 hypothetical protein O3G_MSEX006425 [Manduca sexta]
MSRFFVMFFLASFLVALSASMPDSDIQASSVKLGQCPNNDVISTCVVDESACLGDNECPGSSKCCAWGCGRKCVPAV